MQIYKTLAFYLRRILSIVINIITAYVTEIVKKVWKILMLCNELSVIYCTCSALFNGKFYDCFIKTLVANCFVSHILWENKYGTKRLYYYVKCSLIQMCL